MAKGKKGPSGSDGDGYDIGYGKPPKHSQFKPGQSGNKRGRAKKVRNFATDVADILETPVKLTRDGKSRRISTQFAVLLRNREKALGGDSRAIDRILELARIYGTGDLAASDILDTFDEAILEIHDDRVRRGATRSTSPHKADEEFKPNTPPAKAPDSDRSAKKTPRSQRGALKSASIPRYVPKRKIDD